MHRIYRFVYVLARHTRNHFFLFIFNFFFLSANEKKKNTKFKCESTLNGMYACMLCFHTRFYWIHTFSAPQFLHSQTYIHNTFSVSVSFSLFPLHPRCSLSYYNKTKKRRTFPIKIDVFLSFFLFKYYCFDCVLCVTLQNQLLILFI